jgi:hypothetical protein
MLGLALHAVHQLLAVYMEHLRTPDTAQQSIGSPAPVNCSMQLREKQGSPYDISTPGGGCPHRMSDRCRQCPPG